MIGSLREKIASLEEHYVLGALHLRQKFKTEGYSLKLERLLIKQRSSVPQSPKGCFWPAL